MENKYLNRDAAYFAEKNATDTAREIAGQPATWRKLADYLESNKDEIVDFMSKLSDIPNLRIMLTGAGSSAFIGESMSMLLADELGLASEAVHSTDIVTSPGATLLNVPTALISYSRSGESPESVGVLQYAGKRIDKLFNIVFVCKDNSSVANTASELSDTLVLNMPPESCDLGFAMTASVSCMALATWCVFDYKNLADKIDKIRKIADIAEGEMDRFDQEAQEIAKWTFDRIIYLGSGALKGLAHEASIKMMELTAGVVHAGWDTPTGFRHGPKSVINDTTVTVHLLSTEQFTRKYDDCLAREVLSERKGNKVVCVSPSFEECKGADAEVLYPDSGVAYGAIYSYIMGLIFVQLLGMEKAIVQGNNVDSPSAGGEVNRVVQGVEIYELD